MKDLHIEPGHIVLDDNEILGVIVQLRNDTWEFQQVDGYINDAATLRAVADRIDQLNGADHAAE